jgi:hypothetical protein
MIAHRGRLLQNEERFPDLSMKCMSIPTPFGGRRDASSGRGWAGSVSGPVMRTFPGKLCEGESRRAGNTSLSLMGDAHAAGAKPPRASMKNRTCTGETGRYIRPRHIKSGAP